MKVAKQVSFEDLRPYSNRELYHHGILGQKWGNKNGPPYPLDSSEHSSSEKNAGWRKSLDNSSNKVVDKVMSDGHNKKGLTDSQKKAIKIGVTVAATALATYGTYKLAKSGKLDKYIDIGKDKVEDVLRKKSGSASDFDSILGKQFDNASDKKTAFKKLQQKETISQIVKNTNPHHGNTKYDNNCTACGVAAFLRSAGYDVTAKGTGRNQQILGGVVEECFKGATILDGSAVKFGKSQKDAAEMLINKFGKEASGVVSIQWKRTSGGHTFNWSIENGVAKFFDGQNGLDNVSGYWKNIDTNDSMTLARLDNADPIFEKLTKYVE